jgi:VanZ family protein
MKLTSKILPDFFALWLPVMLWLCFVFFMSTGTFSAENTFSVIGPVLGFLFPRLSPDQIASIHGIIRKSAHVFEYFVLGLLLLRAFRAGSGGGWKWRWSFFALMGVVLYALGDEFHQSFVPTRTASMMDVCIDATGGLLAQCVAIVWHRCCSRPLLCPVKEDCDASDPGARPSP